MLCFLMKREMFLSRQWPLAHGERARDLLSLVTAIHLCSVRDVMSVSVCITLTEAAIHTHCSASELL